MKGKQMTEQQPSLFETRNNSLDTISFEDSTLKSKFQGALVLSAIGDALGWITEFERSKESLKRKYDVDAITDFVSWEKRTGGKFYGYVDYLNKGEYSDDTQLTLCTARCIDGNGDFNPNLFAKKEFPAWLDYARGGGATVKEAAKQIQRKTAQWNTNFFVRRVEGQEVDYRDGGANGAAMRILPIALVNYNNEQRLVRDIWCNAIISHGHPRGILGAVLYGFAIRNVLNHPDEPIDAALFLNHLEHQVEMLNLNFFIPALKCWELEWNKKGNFREEFGKAQREVIAQLQMIHNFLETGTDEAAFDFLGCFAKETKGSGTSTVLAGIFLFLKYQKQNEIEKGILTAVNSIGSDTDSIAAFTGALFGARYGIDRIPQRWLSSLQDREYIISLADRLFFISTGGGAEQPIEAPQKSGAFKLLKHLQTGNINENEIFYHDVFGYGKVTKVEKQKVVAKGKQALLVRVLFDTGQSCKFQFYLRPLQR
jgi:ADP-ribosylglycohydrolase